MVVGFGYYRCGFEGYLGNVGLHKSAMQKHAAAAERIYLIL